MGLFLWLLCSATPRYRTAGFRLSGDFLAVSTETSTLCTSSRPLWGLSLDVELPRRSEPKPTLCRLKWSGTEQGSSSLHHGRGNKAKPDNTDNKTTQKCVTQVRNISSDPSRAPLDRQTRVQNRALGFGFRKRAKRRLLRSACPVQRRTGHFPTAVPAAAGQHY